MNDTAEATAAMTALNGKELSGRTLTVNEARAREERPRPSGNRRPYAGSRR
jgi:RNA recognition motif-containing protein